MIYFGYFFFSLIHLELKRQIRSLENHTRFLTIMVKIYIRYQTKTAQKPYPLGRHMPI